MNCQPPSYMSWSISHSNPALLLAGRAYTLIWSYAEDVWMNAVNSPTSLYFYGSFMEPRIKHVVVVGNVSLLLFAAIREVIVRNLPTIDSVE